MFFSSSEPNGLGAADKLCGLRFPPTHILPLLYFGTELDEDYGNSD
jgi:hypothetical protein